MKAQYNPLQTCSRCDNSWWKRGTYTPKQCPACKSRFWNKPRIRKISEDRMAKKKGGDTYENA